MTSTDLVPISQQSSFDLLPQAHELATAIAKTEFVPKALRNRPEAVMAAVLTGHEVGIGPMQALSKIHVIEGRPAMSAELMRALVLSHGHELWIEEKSTAKVTVCGKRRDSDHTTRITWTLDDAKRAGLAGKQVWRSYPRAMLMARATAELIRDVFPDVLGGISYAKEEVEDGFLFDVEAVDAEPVDEKPATTRRRAKPPAAKKAAAKKAAPAARSAPPLPPLPGEDSGPAANNQADDDVVDAEIVDEPGPAFNVADIGKRATTVFAADYQAAPRGKKTGTVDRLRHAVIHAITGGRTYSSKDLEPEELAKVMATLDDIAEERITYRHDQDDAAGVTFRLQSGREKTVMWSELDEAADENPRDEETEPGQTDEPGYAPGEEPFT